MRAYLILPAFIVFSACAVAQQSADAIARTQAKAYINSVAAQFFPGVNTSAVTDCIIDNATTAEVIEIAQASVTSNSAQAAEVVGQIAQRPDTLNCIAVAGLSIFG